MHHRPVVLVCLLVAAAGCRGGGTDPGISRERFVAANVALRTLPADATDEQRDSVLARYRASPDDLRAWVRAHADEPGVLADAWQQVAARLDSLAETRPGPEPLPDGPPPPPGAIVEEPITRIGKDSLVMLPGLPEALDVPRPERPQPRSRAVPPPPLPPREMVEIQ